MATSDFVFANNEFAEKYIASVFFTKMANFDTQTLLRCRSVSKSWRNAVDSSTRLWRRMPLMKAMEQRRLDICELIVENTNYKNHFYGRMRNTVKENHVNCHSPEFGTILHLAAQIGHADIFRLMMDREDNKNPPAPLLQLKTWWIPIAGRNGLIEFCRLITDNVIDKIPRDKLGYTPLRCAAKNCHFGICGNTPLHSAAVNGHIEICTIIIGNVDDKSPKDCDGNTPLHLAALKGHLEICRLMIDKVDDKSPVGQWGWTPLHMAAYGGHTEVCRFLMTVAEDKNPEDQDGDTPLDLAAQHGHSDVCSLISSYLLHHRLA